MVDFNRTVFHRNRDTRHIAEVLYPRADVIFRRKIVELLDVNTFCEDLWKDISLRRGFCGILGAQRL